jgi:hypothetical protein
MTSCSGDDNLSGSGSGMKFSPPAWIQGSWGEEGIVAYKFTSNDIFLGSTSFKTIFQNVVNVSYTCKETKQDALYEVKITQKVSGKEIAAATYSCKKGDGSYIEVACVEGDNVIRPSDYVRFYKLN